MEGQTKPSVELVVMIRMYKYRISYENIYKVANSRLGWYKRFSMNVVNFIINSMLLEMKTKERHSLVNPLQYYL